MSNYQFWVNTVVLLATIFAIVYGPIRAVKVARNGDLGREDRARKYAILSDLMRTRQARIDPVHVSALNLIELEFYDREKIVAAYRAYSRHLNSNFPSEGEALSRHTEEGTDLFSDLLCEIARNLGFEFDKRDLSRLGYLPVGLSRFHDNSLANSHLLREILEGKRPLHISNFVSNQSIFPPTPNKKITDQSEQ